MLLGVVEEEVQVRVWVRADVGRNVKVQLPMVVVPLLEQVVVEVVVVELAVGSSSLLTSSLHIRGQLVGRAEMGRHVLGKHQDPQFPWIPSFLSENTRVAGVC